jgi:hypothetical protein
MGNRPRIKPRIHEWMAVNSRIREEIRVWSLHAAKVNALPALCSSERLQSPSFQFGDGPQSASGEELSA